MVPGVGDGAVLVVPDEGVIAVGGIRNGGVARFRGHDGVREAHDVAVIQGQGHVANDLALLGHRGGPAHDALEAPAMGILPAGKGFLLRLIGNGELLRLFRGHRPDHPGVHVGADHVRNMDFPGFEFLQFGKIAFRLAPGIFLARHIPQTPW
jgi:hypothetical protein